MTKRRALARLLAPLLLVCAALSAGAGEILNIACPDSVPEGRAFLVHVDASARCDSIFVEWLGREYALDATLAEGRLRAETLLGTGMHERQAKGEFLLRVRALAGNESWSELRRIVRAPMAYPEQHLDVARKYTELSAEDLARHEGEKVLVGAAKATLSAARLWSAPLRRPVPGKVNSDFGLRRFFNGEPKAPHGGVDLKAAKGDPILACADGRVILAGEHFFAGHSVYLDHGQGLVSMYFHLSRVDVTEGDLLRAGEPLGLVGSSGRVTGPHLHWGLCVHGQLVDPLPLLAD